MPAFVSESDFEGSPEATFDLMVTLENWPTFKGHGPLPGIVRATAPGGILALGTRVRVENTDRSVHHEQVVAFERGRRFAVRMELSPPASWLMQHIDEEVVLTATAQGTHMWRRFETAPRFFFTLPLVLLITHLLLKPAVMKHDRLFGEQLRLPAT